MSALDRLAERMFGRQRLETTAAMASVDTQTYIGVATSDSADGSVSVVLSDDVTQPDNGIWDGDTFLASDELGTSVELPTTTSVKEGDRVLVTASGANVLTAPVVTGVVGRGDEQQAQIDAAAEAAASVEGIAQEALDGVEQVRQDVADFRDDVATTYATKVERQDGDDAVKTWVTTNYTNSNDLATTYATKTLVSQTKDAIELAASQTYETQSDAAATYATQSALTVGLDGIRTEVAEDYQPKGDYATTASMNSAIQQSASSIESSVAATYTTKAEFEGLQVGATNLAKGTSATTELSGTLASTGANYLDFCTYTITRIEGATEYVVSFEAYASAACTVLCYWWSPNTTTKASSSTGQSGTNADGRCEVTLTTGWKRYWVKWTQSDSAATDKKLIVCRILKPSSGSLTVHVRAVKMETGNMPTDWSPAPEDMATTYATKTEVQQTAAGLDTRITTAQSTADGAASTASTAAGNAATALSTANDALADSVEYIIGTQTAATNAWTGQTRDAALVAGKTIAYKLPYAGNSSAATLNLTLSGGGTTGAKGVRRMADNNANYTVTTQYGAGAVVQMTYDGEFWRVSSGYNPTNDINNARYRTQIPSAVKAAAAYTTGHIICGTSAGYKNIGAGVAFDLGYPLLYATASVAAGATGTANYLEFENRNASTNGTIQSGAANKTLYLKGTVSGNTFTIAASPFMTTVVPTSEDGFCYIPLGLMYSATNIYFQSSDQLYAYTEGAFQPIGRGALATAQAEVTERQTLIRQFSGGVLAGYVGNAIAALVNAAGSFDVVRTAWSGGVPSILGTLATFGANLIRIGEETGQNVLITSAGQFFRKGLNNLLAIVAGSSGHTYSFTIEDGVYSYPLPFGESIAGDPTISVGGHTLTWSDCQLQFNYENAGYSLLFSGDFDPATYAGQTATMTYNTSSSLSVFDGLGTAAQNIISFFDARGITLLGGRGVIQGNTSKQVGSAITDGGAVVGHNVMDVNVIRLANSSPDPDDAYAYLAIRANETYVANADGEKVEGDVDYWRSGVQLVSQDDFGKVSVGLAAGMVGLQGDYLALSTSDTSTSDSFPMQQAINALNCRSNSNGWVNSDSYPNTNRAIYVGAMVNNSSSSVNGHNISLYLGPAGLNLYDATAARTLWNFGLNNPHFAVWAGTKVMTINASSFTLFTKAQLQAIVGTDWTPTGTNCSVFVMNGDHGVTVNMMSASIDASSIVRVHMNASRNGALRVNYLIIRFA